jgi:hypothetical protein
MTRWLSITSCSSAIGALELSLQAAGFAVLSAEASGWELQIAARRA